MRETKLINIEPATRRLLPGFRVALTPALWRTIAGDVPIAFDDERLRDLGFYILFALAGMIGTEDGRLPELRTMLVPVAFDSGTTQMRIALERGTGQRVALVLSLPEETNVD